MIVYIVFAIVMLAAGINVYSLYAEWREDRAIREASRTGLNELLPPLAPKEQAMDEWDAHVSQRQQHGKDAA